MSRIDFSGISFRNLPKALPSLRSLDWKVGAAAALAIVALGVVFALVSKRGSFSSIHVTIDKLDFTPEILQQKGQIITVVGSAFQNWTFAEVCTTLLTAIQRESKVQQNYSNTFELGKQNSEDVLRLLDLGLPDKVSYEDASEQQKPQSWIHQILIKLREKNYIANFWIRIVIERPDVPKYAVITIHRKV